MSGGLLYGLIGGLIIGLSYGLIGALCYGGLDIIRHYTLPLILIIQGHTPQNYARFLDHAARLTCLQKVVGGYASFIAYCWSILRRWRGKGRELKDDHITANSMLSTENLYLMSNPTRPCL